MEIVFSFIYLVIALILLVFTCIVFTNAIEHLGERLNLSHGAVGSVLAAVGTALPETIVPIVAIVGGYLAGGNTKTADEIGIGAILGAPFMLGTLAFFVTGLAVLIYSKTGRRTTDMPVCTIVMFRDMHYFMGAYLIAILSSFIPYYPLKAVIAVLLVAAYVVYAVQTIRTSSNLPDCEEEELGELFLSKYLKGPDSLFGIVFQIIVSLLGIILLAHMFVEQIKVISESFHVNPLFLSLIITPIATELPEKLNSVIWIRAKKDTLAMGNITGAMVFQSCIPPAVGILLTPWILSVEALINVVIVYISVIIVYLNIMQNRGVLKPTSLLSGGLFYLIYLFYVIFKINHA